MNVYVLRIWTYNNIISRHLLDKFRCWYFVLCLYGRFHCHVSHFVLLQQEVLRQVQAERDALAARLDALTEEHSRIVNQQQDRTELDDDHNQTTGDGDSSSTSGVLTWEQLTPQNFVQLQNNFAALQVSVVKPTVI